MAGSSDKKTDRLSKEKWLEEALLALSKDPTHLRVDEIAARLGVSKGSFYWHFEGRADFVKALAEYWRDTESGLTAQKIMEGQSVFFVATVLCKQRHQDGNTEIEKYSPTRGMNRQRPATPGHNL